MAMLMPSDELQLLIAGYVLGDLSPEEAAQFEQLLAQNPAIAEEVAQLQTVLETAYAPPEVTPPSHLRDVILERADIVTPVSSRATAQTSGRRLPWRMVMEVAAAGLIVALGVNNYRLSRALQVTQAQPQADTPLTYILDATQANVEASATVVVDPNNLEATLSVQNLPPLPPGKVYVLWTVLRQDAPFTTDDKAAILTEVFQVDEQGNFSQTIPVPRAYQSGNFVAKVAVTIEDANAPQRHTGTPIMITGS